MSGLKYMTCPAAEVLPAENTPGISAVPSQPLQQGGDSEGKGRCVLHSQARAAISLANYRSLVVHLVETVVSSMPAVGLGSSALNSPGIMETVIF